MQRRKVKILLVLSGGTVCTTVRDSKGIKTRSISKDADVLLRKNFHESGSAFADQVEIDTGENLGVLSENMTIGKWNQLIAYFRNEDKLDRYDGIVIAHGTDTLAYSASLFSLVLKSLAKPVFLVASNKPLTSADANGNDNFRAAVELISCGIASNVYVTYRNPADGAMYLHLGARLLQCKAYDENFYSEGALRLPDAITGNNISQLSEALPLLKKSVYDEMISLSGDWSLSNCVLKIDPYVGLDYSAYNYNKFKAVLHGTYHSGTVCENSSEYREAKSDDSILSLIDRPDRNFDIYISPSDLQGEIYETVFNVLNHSNGLSGVYFLSGMTNEMLYAKLLIAYSLADFAGCEIMDFIKSDIAGEMVCC